MSTIPQTARPSPAEGEPEAPQSAPPRRPRDAVWIWTSVVQLMWVFALYVLSTGPMYWYCYSAFTLGDNPVLQRLYQPLAWLAERSEWFSDWLDWWIGLWIL